MRPTGKRGAKPDCGGFEFIAKERCRQRCVDEARGDEVDPDGRYFNRQICDQCGCSRGAAAHDPHAHPRPAATRAAHKQQRAAARHPADNAWATATASHKCSSKSRCTRSRFEVGQRRAVTTAGCDHDVVDPRRQALEELIHRSRNPERSSAPRVNSRR